MPARRDAGVVGVLTRPRPTADGQKAGVTAEGAAKAASGARSKLSLQEAQMILNVEANTPWEEVVKARAPRQPPQTRPVDSAAFALQSP